MFCMKCGTQLPDDAMFCFKCGTQTGAAAQMGAVAQAPQQAAGKSAQALFEEGQALYDNCEEEKAVELFRKAADMGHADAQFYLGKYYFEGMCMTQDKAKGIELYRKAADGGNVNAMLVLGDIYFKGKDAAKDETKAFELWKKATDTGDIMALHFMGNFYFTDGANKNFSKAVEWYSKCAEKGFSFSMYNLGCCYEIGGYGIQQDYAKAAEWYSKGAAKGDSGSKYQLDKLKAEGKI